MSTVTQTQEKGRVAPRRHQEFTMRLPVDLYVDLKHAVILRPGGMQRFIVEAVASKLYQEVNEQRTAVTL